MLYCSDKRNLEGNIIRNIIPRNKRIYYDSANDLFFDQYHQIISVKDRVVVPLSNENSLREFYTLLKNKGVLFTNGIEDIKKIERWYEYIEPNRKIVSFTSKDLNDLSFLTYLIELFGNSDKVCLSNKHKSIATDMSILIQGFIPLYANSSERFLLSEKIEITEDEYGPIIYQVLIERGKLINLSRLVETKEYIKIPREVFSFIFDFLDSLPEDFPKTFILRVASTKSMYELIDLKPLEKSDTMTKIRTNNQLESSQTLSKKVNKSYINSVHHLHFKM